jgi:hypothetical protein
MTAAEIRHRCSSKQVDLPGQFSYYNAQLITKDKYQLRTGKEIRFRFWLSEDKAGKEAKRRPTGW